MTHRGISSQIEGLHFERAAATPTLLTIALREDESVDLIVAVRVKAKRVPRLPPRLRRALLEVSAAVLEHTARTQFPRGGPADGPLAGVIDVKPASDDEQEAPV